MVDASHDISCQTEIQSLFEQKKKSLNSFDQFYIYSKIYGNAFNSLFWYGLNSYVCDEQGFFDKAFIYALNIVRLMLIKRHSFF